MDVDAEVEAEARRMRSPTEHLWDPLPPLQQQQPPPQGTQLQPKPAQVQALAAASSEFKTPALKLKYNKHGNRVKHHSKVRTASERSRLSSC
jgi:hypothetical protein